LQPPPIPEKLKQPLVGDLRTWRLIRSIDRFKYQILLALGLFSALDADGSQKLLQFRHLTTDDGLSSSIVISLLQDYKGFMWCGTYDGLNRYDGTTMVTYKNVPSDSTSLIENHVESIFEDHDHNLLIGTRDGIALYDRDADRFINYKYAKSSPLYNISILVNQICEDTLGNLWLATNLGLIYFDRGTNTIVRYAHDPQDPRSISHDNMDNIHLDKRGRLWVATKKGLNLFDPRTKKFNRITHCATHHDDISAVFFLEILEEPTGKMWFGSAEGLFCLENPDQEEDLALTHFNNDPNSATSLSINRARSLLQDIDGNLWIGTENGGINIYNKEKRCFYHCRIDDFNPMSLNNESIHSLTRDRQNNVWVGTYGGGVNIAVKNSDFIIHYRNLPAAPQSLSFNIISGFAQDRFNRIWVGTDGGGFNLFNDTTGEFTRYNTRNSPIKSNAITCMIGDNENQIWMGAWEGGLIRYDCLDTTIHSSTTDNSAIPDNSIFSIARDSLGNLWLGSFRHGLIRYRIKENSYVYYSTTNSAITSNEIRVVRTDRHGNVFLGADNCFQIFHPAENRFDTDNRFVPGPERGRYNVVYDILIENDTCTWVATQNGLYRYDQSNGKCGWYYESDGLPSNMIRGVTMDRAGMIWLTTNAGLCRFDRHKNKTITFKKSDGLQGNEFYRSSIFLTNAGKILAGGPNGFNLISPDKYSENRSIPEVVITDFHLFNEKVEIGAKGSPLQKQISETKKLTLSYKQSVLTFYFNVMDFTNPAKNRYAYWMENFDKGWTYCGTRKDATYTNLFPGNYLFHVKGANNDGVWNESGTTLELVITPPWWQTKWARAGFILLMLLVLVWIYFYFRNKQEQKHLREIVTFQKKTEDIMQAIDEAIFTVNQDMSINREHSKIAEKIFATTEFEKQNIAALFAMNAKTRSNFGVWLDLAFKRKWTAPGWEKHLRLNPVKEVILEREGRLYLSVHYQPIYENEALSRIMVLVNDITVQKRVEQYLSALNDEKELQMERVFGLVSNDYDCVISILDLSKRVIHSFEEINFDATELCKPRLKELGRDLHTLKGTGGSMAFETLAKHCDELESALMEYLAATDHSGSDKREQLNKAVGKLTREIQAMVELRAKLYSGKEDKLGVDKVEYEKYLEQLKNGGFRSIKESIYRFRMLTAVKFSEICAEFSKIVSEYGARFEKSIEPLRIETPEAKLERKICKVLKGPVIHLIRNAVDHGIEDDTVREKLGKGPGHISMALRENNEMIELEIADDGGGIDPERVAASAIKKGVITPEQAQSMTVEQKRDLIFLHGFSTKDETTTVSGRGVGMDAVKTDIEKAGGSLKLISHVGKGTHITLMVPNPVVEP
jgi:ligand-binding sensor domain-containing protein/HPt (histidine-containing phosphotransfer) domain-containing protein